MTDHEYVPAEVGEAEQKVADAAYAAYAARKADAAAAAYADAADAEVAYDAADDDAHAYAADAYARAEGGVT